jgi:8-oxo-dGTP pyrophosphatase MutT (NUDIX family)
MEKVISAGILVTYKGKYVIGHVTGTDYFDIFKGRTEPGETLTQTAIRECREESSLDFSSGVPLRVLGTHNFTKKKDLALYVARIDELDITQLKCEIINETKIPEMDCYELVTFDEMIQKVSKNMSILLDSLSRPPNNL